MKSIKFKTGNNVTVAKEWATKSTSATGTKQSGHSGQIKALSLPARFDKLERLQVWQMRRIFGEPDSPFRYRLRIVEGTLPPVDGRKGMRPYWSTSTVRSFLKKQA